MQTALLSLGESRLKAGQADKAAEAWERALATDPANLDLRRQLATLAEKNGLIDRAVEHLTEIARISGPEERATVTLRLARLFQDRGEIPEAIAVLERGLAITAADNWLHDELLKRLIEAHRTAGSLPKLEQEWVRTARRNERDPANVARLIAFYRAMGNAANERIWLDQAMELNPRDAGPLRRAARLASDAGDVERASALGRQLLELDPGSLDTVFFIAEMELRRNDTTAAAGVVNELLDRHPTVENLAQAARFFARNRLWNAAEHALKRAASMTPHNPEAIRSLAEFYFDRNRRQEGRAAAASLVDPLAGPEAQAAAYRAAADLLKGEGDNQEAARLLEKAVALAPTPESREQLASALAAADRPEDAIEQLRAGLREAVDPGVAAALDRSLHALLASFPFEELAESVTIPGLGDVPLGSGRSDQSRRLMHPRLAQELQRRRSDADADPSPDRILALARWERLNRKHSEAVATASRITPATERSLEFIAETAGEGGLYTHALAALRQLAVLRQGAGRTAVERRIARTLLDARHRDEAIAAYTKLVEADGASPQALGELAEAYQRVDRWQDALATWQTAFEKSRPGDRETTLKAYARALTQLGRAGDALDLIDAELAHIRDETRRERLLLEALQFARRNALDEAYRGRWQERVARAPADDFARQALATILKKSGESRAAYNLLTTPLDGDETAQELRQRVAAASEFGDLTAAIQAQQRLVQLDDTVESRVELARLYEAAFDIATAEQLWTALAARELRNVDVLVEAADFFGRIGRVDTRRDLLRQAVAIDANQPAAHFELGRLLMDQGDQQSAASEFEAVLEITEPAGDAFEPPIVPPVFVVGLLPALVASAEATLSPVVGEMGSALRDLARRSATAPATKPGIGRMRLDAIRFLAGMQSTPAAREKWVARWRSQADCVEALHAFHFSEAHAETHEWFQRRLAADADLEMRLNLVWSAIQRRDDARLGAWIAGMDEMPRRQFALLAVGAAMLWHGRVGESLIAALFPDDFRVRETLWQAAQTLAGGGELEPAIMLARRAFGSELVRRDEALAVAAWEVALGRPGEAKALLEDVMNSGGRGLAAPAYAALRARFLLESPEDQRGFVDAQLSRMSGAERLPRALSRLLLAALVGDPENVVPEAARDFVAALPLGSASSPGSGNSLFSAVLSSAFTLRDWDLPEAAVQVIDAALADAARISLLDEPARIEADQAGSLRAALLVALASPGDRAQLLEEYAARGQDWMRALASQLEAMGQNAPAGLVYRKLLAGVTDNETLLRAAAVNLAEGRQVDAARETFLESIASGQTTLPEPALAQVVGDLASALNRREDHSGALLVLERVRSKQPRDPEVRRRLAMELSAHGRLQDAVNLLSDSVRGDPSDWVSRGLLAQALENMERYDEALSALGLGKTMGFAPATGPLPGAAERVAARIRISRGEAALVAENRAGLLRENGGEILADAVRSLFAGGSPNRALVLARHSLEAAPGVQGVPILAAFIEALTAVEKIPAPYVLHCLRRFDSLRDGDVRNLQSLSAITKLVPQRPDRDELREYLTGLAESSKLAWYAGDVIAAFAAVKDQERLQRVVAGLERESTPRVQNLQEAIAALHATGYHDEAVRLSRRYVAVRTAELNSHLTLALALDRAGKPDEAEAVLARARQLAVFDINGPARLALCRMEMRDLTSARDALRDAAERDPLRRREWLWEALARAQIRLGDQEGAIAALKQQCTPTMLAEYAVAFSRISELAMDAKPFGVSRGLMDAVGVHVCRELLRGKKLEPTIEFAGRNPQILTRRDFPLETLCALAADDQVAILAGIMETALQTTDSWPLSRALARVYVRLSGVDRDRAIQWLKRSIDLQPQEFSSVRAAATRLHESGNTDSAKDLLEFYLRRVQSPARKADAEAFLATLRGRTPVIQLYSPAPRSDYVSMPRLSLVLIAASFGGLANVCAQIQEGRMRSILEPDQTRQADFQHKTFNGAGAFRLKSARVKSFEVRSRQRVKSFSPRTAQTGEFYDSSKVAPTRVLPAVGSFATGAPREVDPVEVGPTSDANKRVSTRDLPERDRKPASGSGFFSLPLPGDNPNRKEEADGQLTIEQVREILNKTR